MAKSEGVDGGPPSYIRRIPEGSKGRGRGSSLMVEDGDIVNLKALTLVILLERSAMTGYGCA